VSLLTVRLARKTPEAANICAFEWVDVNGGELPAFEAGAHVDFHLPGGLVRSYSLYNAPGERHRYCVGVLLDANTRGGSKAMHALQEGDTVQITPPSNHFPLVPGHSQVLLAGGIGVTPILSMAQTLAAQGAEFVLHYAARSAQNAAFVPWLQASSFAARVHTHWDDGAPAQRLDMAQVLANPAAGKHLYVCGPQGFIDAAMQQARQLGWAEDCLHFELFGAQVSAQDGDQPFEVVIAGTGQRFTIPVDKTVIQVLHAAGVDVPIACEQGVCGTCLTRVVEGVPDHRDQYLTPEEQAANDQFTPCCSRSKTPSLTLEV